MHDFTIFSKAIYSQFNEMSKSRLFVVDVSSDQLWDYYLNSFPEGTNQIYKTNREYDCSCCRGFIRNIGAVVTLNNNTIQSVWDGGINVPFPYDVVSTQMRNLVKSSPIKTLFLTSQRHVGTESNIQQLDNGSTVKWNHFHCEVPLQFISSDIGSRRSTEESTARVVQRGFEEITRYAIDTVLDLVQNNSIYRGHQYLKQLRDFSDAHMTYNALTSQLDKNHFVWRHNTQSLAIRNTSIGQLLINLSEGMDVEQAVRSYETMVAPANYRRTSAPITQGMVAKAEETLQKLNLLSALNRRHAVAEDVAIADVIFANRSTASVMRSALGDLLSNEVQKSSKTVKAGARHSHVSMEHFLTQVLPNSTRLEVLFDNKLTGNLMSVTAPVDPSSGRLFPWDNSFAWSYNGDLTDSIKERVKKAGGNVQGVCRVSLSWSNYDDLDLHVIEPNGAHIYYADKSPRGALGRLDVDMNAGGPTTRSPVENVTWDDDISPGVHRVLINNFHKRESIDVGFTVEVEFNGNIQTFSYDKALRNRDTIRAFAFHFGNNGLQIRDVGVGIQYGHRPLNYWGMNTGSFQEVSMLCLSPNFWSGQHFGNKHWFFILEGANNPEPTRGIYNEFLRQELRQHRKVFEVLADKTKCPPVERQLSGLGFSSTIPNELMVRVDGTRTYIVQFGGTTNV